MSANFGYVFRCLNAHAVCVVDAAGSVTRAPAEGEGTHCQARWSRAHHWHHTGSQHGIESLMMDSFVQTLPGSRDKPWTRCSLLNHEPMYPSSYLVVNCACNTGSWWILSPLLSTAYIHRFGGGKSRILGAQKAKRERRALGRQELGRWCPVQERWVLRALWRALFKGFFHWWCSLSNICLA